jgi:hypothetical protein
MPRNAHHHKVQALNLRMLQSSRRDRFLLPGRDSAIISTFFCGFHTDANADHHCEGEGELLVKPSGKVPE